MMGGWQRSFSLIKLAAYYIFNTIRIQLQTEDKDQEKQRGEKQHYKTADDN